MTRRQLTRSQVQKIVGLLHSLDSTVDPEAAFWEIAAGRDTETVARLVDDLATLTKRIDIEMEGQE